MEEDERMFQEEFPENGWETTDEVEAFALVQGLVIHAGENSLGITERGFHILALLLAFTDAGWAFSNMLRSENEAYREAIAKLKSGDE